MPDSVDLKGKLITQQGYFYFLEWCYFLEKTEVKGLCLVF